MEFLDWAYLATYAGALAVVTLITELIKDRAFLAKIPTQIVSWALAYIVITLAQLFTGVLTASSAALNIFNAAMVSLGANGGYSALKRIVDGKTESEDE